MDLLSKRYANPCFLLDGYIQTSQFCEFIDNVYRLKNEDDMWEYYLHKVFDKTFNEFKEELENTQRVQTMSGVSMVATVKKSMEILGSFQPPKEGE